MKRILLIGALLLNSVAVLHGQKVQLAGLTLGMDESQIREALGPTYTYELHPSPQTQLLTYLAAYKKTPLLEAYGAILVAGKLNAFSYTKSFAPGSEPSAESLVKSVTAKTWQPSFPLSNGVFADGIWVLDNSGKRMENSAFNYCQDGYLWNDSFQAGGLSFPAPKSLSPAWQQNAKCGLVITISNSENHPRLASSTTLRVINPQEFLKLSQFLADRQAQKQNQDVQRGNQVKSPF